MRTTPNSPTRPRRLALVLAGLSALAVALPAPAEETDAPPADTTEEPEARSGSFNVRSALELTADATFEARGAILQVARRRALANQQMKVVVQGVDRDEELDLYMENEHGVMVQIGELEARGRSSQIWRVRTKRGDALPFGVADVAELSDRRIEIRADGEGAAYAGECPSAEPTSEGGNSPRARSSLEVSAEVAISWGGGEPGEGDAPCRALIDVRRKRNGTETLSIDVRNAPPDLTLTAYLEAAFGFMVPIGTLEPDPNDDPSDDDCDYALDVRWVASAATLGVLSVSDLAGHDIEIRTESGAVLAVGTVPAVKPRDEPSGGDAAPGEAGGDEEDDGGLLGGL